jgi:hypothetical protein
VEKTKKKKNYRKDSPSSIYIPRRAPSFFSPLENIQKEGLEKVNQAEIHLKSWIT